MTKEERITAKIAELMEIYKELPEEKLKVASDLIEQAAFMAVTLDDLSVCINEEGVTEEYTNGANQSGRKISSNAKMYGVLISKYSAIVSRLLKLVPSPKKLESKGLAEYEKKAIQKQKDAEEFRAACDFVERATNNSSEEIKTQIKEIWRECSWNNVETARVIKERGLYNE